MSRTWLFILCLGAGSFLSSLLLLQIPGLFGGQQDHLFVLLLSVLSVSFLCMAWSIKPELPGDTSHLE